MIEADLNMRNSKTSNTVELDKNNNSKAAFYIFCGWTFVLLCRPQDLFPVLAPLRPAFLASALTLATVITSYKYLSDNPLFQSRQIKLYLTLYFVMIFGIPFSLYVRLSFERVITEQIITVLFVCIFFKLVSSIERLYSVLLISCLGSGLYFLYALREFAPGTGRLAYGTMFDPNDLAFFVLGFLPLNILFIFRKNTLRLRLLCVATFTAGLLLLLLTGSRGGFLGLLVMIVVLLLFSAKSLNRLLKVGVLVFCVFIFVIAPVDKERLSTITSLEDDYNTYDETGRLAIWKIGMRVLFSNPLTGVGVGNFGEAVGNDRQRRGLIPKWQTAHSSIVQIGTETGFVGLFLFLALSLNVFRVFWKIKKAAQNIQLNKICEMGLAGFAGMFTAGMFLSQAYSIYWAYYVSLSAIVYQLSVNDQASLKEIKLNGESK